MLPPALAQTAAQKKAEAAKAATFTAYAVKHPIRGIAFHCCSCAVPCPCMFNGKDIEGCNIVTIYHFTDGGYVGKHLNGLTIVLVPHPEDLKKTSKIRNAQGEVITTLVYIPEGLTPQQEHDLVGTLYENKMSLGMMSTQRRKAPLRFTSVIEPSISRKKKPLVGYELEIPKILHIRTFGLPGANGKPVMVDHLTLSEGSLWTIGKTKLHEFQAPDEPEWHWSLPETNGSWTAFTWTYDTSER